MWRGGWTFLRRIGSPGELVITPIDEDGRRLASFCRPTAAAVVLGSTQKPEAIDDERRMRLGYELVKRRSGGGAVVVTPAAQVWVDLFVPRDDPLYEEDVGRAAHWVAELWGEVLGAIAPEETVQPILAHTPTKFSRAVCFSGLGPGEVTVGGRKVVGVSQRRGRSGAWFFTMALRANAQGDLSELLALDDSDRAALACELAVQVGTVAAAGDVLEDAVASSLSGGAV